MDSSNKNLALAEQFIAEITSDFMEIVVPKLAKKENSSAEQGINKYLQQGLMNSFLHSYLTPFVSDELIQKYATQEKIKAQLKKSLSCSSTSPKYIQLWDKYFEEIRISGKQPEFEEKMLEIIRGELKGKHHKSKHFKDYSPNLRLLALFNLIRIHSLPECSEICDLWFRCFGKSIRTRKSKHQKNKEKLQEKSKRNCKSNGNSIEHEYNSYSSFEEINESSSNKLAENTNLTLQGNQSKKGQNFYVKEEHIYKKQKLNLDGEVVISSEQGYCLLNNEDLIFHSEDEDNQSSTSIHPHFNNIQQFQQQQQQVESQHFSKLQLENDKDYSQVHVEVSSPCFNNHQQQTQKSNNKQQEPFGIQLKKQSSDLSQHNQDENQIGLQFDDFLFSCSDNNEEPTVDNKAFLFGDNKIFAQQLQKQTQLFAQQPILTFDESNNYQLNLQIQQFSNIPQIEDNYTLIPNYARQFYGFGDGLDLQY